MKRRLIMALCVVLGFCACDNTEKFNVNVSLQNTDESTMIYLRKIVDHQTVVVDSAMFKNETAVLIAPFDDPQLLYSIKIKGIRGSMEFFPENQDVIIVGDLENPSAVEFLGGDAQTLYAEYFKNDQAFSLQIYELYPQLEEAYNNGDTVAIQAINEQGDAIMTQQQAYFDDFILEHRDHFVSHYLLASKKQDFSLEELKAKVAQLTNPSIYINDINEYIEKLEHLEVGNPCLDFTLKTADGQEVVLSEYLKDGQLTLIDFWASWCGPCRNENPHVVAAYEKYHAQGFNVLGVSLDQDAGAWQQAVAADGLTWTQVRDVDGTVSDSYLIYYIPSNFLINAEGIIVAKNLRGEELEQAILEHL